MNNCSIIMITIDHHNFALAPEILYDVKILENDSSARSQTVFMDIEGHPNNFARMGCRRTTDANIKGHLFFVLSVRPETTCLV